MCYFDVKKLYALHGENHHNPDNMEIVHHSIASNILNNFVLKVTLKRQRRYYIFDYYW